ncbi:MAG: PAS domain S-box protein [Anaerolineaceae bacterium]|nr:PAS domain S-box protein [Anaerolineaceae bacterium]
MIEFKVASLANNPNNGVFWQGLNAASIAVQQAAQSEAAVYRVFSEQLVKLGLHGCVAMLDETGENLYITSIVFSDRLMRVIHRAEKLMKINSQDFTYPAHASRADQVVLSQGDAVFLHDNSEKMRQILPPNIYRFAGTVLKPFLKLPAILAPVFANSEVKGMLYVAGKNLQLEDVPAIVAFATHLSIALENARLFQAVQEAEAKYRRLFETANDGIFLFDQNSRQIISANPKMLQLLGVEEADLGAVQPGRWATSEVYEQYSEHLKLAMQKGNHFFEVPFVDLAGNERQWQISTTVVELDGRPVLNGLVRDITEAKQAEVALRQREEQLRVLAENVPGTIYLCKNEPNFPYLYVNDGIEDLTGYPKEQFLNQEVLFLDLVHPDDRHEASLVPSVAELQRQGRFHYVYRLRHRSGEWRWAEEVGGGVFDEQGNLLFLEGVVSDITERVQADLLQKAVYRIAAVAHTNISLEELYHAIHEALAPILNVQNFYIALYEDDMLSVPYFIDKFDASPGVYQMGKGLTEFVIRTNKAQLLTRQQILFYVQQGVLEVKGTMPEAWLGVPLQTRGTAIGALVVQSYEESTAYSEQDRQFLMFVSDQVANVVERKQAEDRQRQLSEELRQQTRLLEAILSATPDNFLVADLNGRLCFVSENILRFLKLAAEQVVGKTWPELQIPAQFGEMLDEDWAAVRRLRAPVTREFQFPMPQGDREIEFITTPVWDENGEIVSLVTTTRDVTERRQTVRAMHRAQKMESLGVLAGGIAHDFNNLLVAMLGQASLAQAHLTPSHTAYTHVTKAVQAAEQAAGLTRQLLAYSGGGQFTISPLNLNTLIRESIDLLRVALPKQIVLELALAEALPLIEADIAQLQQVMMNLLINAAESIGEQPGTIRVYTAVCQITSLDKAYWRYTNQPLTPGAYVCLQVKDSGSGMTSETLSKIFDPFFTTKFTGRGLGLAAVLGIVRGHHGGLQVTSQPDVGTTFELLFPVSSAAVEAPHTPQAPAANTAVSGLVLVIDDEAAVREAVSDILEMEGINVLAAANGDAGIALYQEQAEAIDLVLLDLSMPGKSGHETFEALKEIDPNVRILLSSGYSEADATRGFTSPPLVGFLQKPYRLDSFVQRLKKHL